MLHLLRPYVERFPALAHAFRHLRDELRLRALAPRATPWGFSLLGDDSMVDGRFEPDETALLGALFGDADVFVDVGAYVGLFTCMAATRGLRAVAVEPLDENLRCLYANLHNNGLRDVEVFPMGLAETAGLRTLYGGTTGASLREGWSNASAQVARTVPVTTLDTLLRGRFEGRRLVVKMDIEGAELDALAGCAETLARTPAPVWLVEVCLTENLPVGAVNGDFSAVFERFWGAGYGCRSVGPDAREVTPDDVARWTAARARDFGTPNFLFTRAMA